MIHVLDEFHPIQRYHTSLEKTEYVEETRERFGSKAAKEIDFLLERNSALFAGGALDQEAKDTFFEAVTKAYWAAKEEARKTYGRKISHQ